jgi:hypothetical protein
VIWLLLACAEPEPADLPDVFAPVTGEPVAWELSFDWDGHPLESGARSFQTDQGYAVTLTEALVSTIQLELVPCGDEAARFDHPGDVADTTRVVADIVEDALAGEPTVAGEGVARGHAYCRAHELMGPVEGLVVALSGGFTPPGEAGERPFEAEVSVASGVLVDLGDGAWGDDNRIEVVRYPARALDGLVLEDLSDVDLAYEFARGLAVGAEARWWLAP